MAKPVGEIEMKLKTKKEIEKALHDSIKYFKKTRRLKALAVANEICTLKWVLGEGVLNCYSEDK